MWGSGYSIPSAEGNEAIEPMMKQEGIVPDTCYTGEGFCKSDDNVLFAHAGGAGGLCAQDWDAEE